MAERMAASVGRLYSHLTHLSGAYLPIVVYDINGIVITSDGKWSYSKRSCYANLYATTSTYMKNPRLIGEPTVYPSWGFPDHEGVTGATTESGSGITGMQINMVNLPSVQLTAQDFTFKMLDMGTEEWVDAPTPSSITVGRSSDVDRRGLVYDVDMEWPDDSIKDTWLETTVKPDRLPDFQGPSQFYFRSQPYGRQANRGNTPDHSYVVQPVAFTVKKTPDPAKDEKFEQEKGWANIYSYLQKLPRTPSGNCWVKLTISWLDPISSVFTPNPGSIHYSGPPPGPAGKPNNGHIDAGHVEKYWFNSLQAAEELRAAILDWVGYCYCFHVSGAAPFGAAIDKASWLANTCQEPGTQGLLAYEPALYNGAEYRIPVLVQYQMHLDDRFIQQPNVSKYHGYP